jgi:hypothetical protein
MRTGRFFFPQMKNEKKHGSTGSHYVFLSRSVTTEDAGKLWKCTSVS